MNHASIYDPTAAHISRAIGLCHQEAQQLGETLAQKRQLYGDNLRNGGQFLKILFPNGIPIEAYGDLLIIARVLDKIMRVANLHLLVAAGVTGVSETESPWHDIAGYGIARLVDIALEEEGVCCQNFHKDI